MQYSIKVLKERLHDLELEYNTLSSVVQNTSVDGLIKEIEPRMIILEDKIEDIKEVIIALIGDD